MNYAPCTCIAQYSTASASSNQCITDLLQIGLSTQYNFYNFKKSKPDLLKFDISGCYQFGQRRKFQFMLKGKLLNYLLTGSRIHVTFMDKTYRQSYVSIDMTGSNMVLKVAGQ